MSLLVEGAEQGAPGKKGASTGSVRKQAPRSLGKKCSQLPPNALERAADGVSGGLDKGQFDACR